MLSAVAIVVILTMMLGGGLGYGVLGGDAISLTMLLAGDGVAWQLLDLRLPRLMVDAAGGALFASSGLILQGVTRNPLASPSVLGSQMSALAVLAGSCYCPNSHRAGACPSPGLGRPWH